MRELALFAGAGGGILGGKLLGWRTVCAVELDSYARSVLLARQRDGCLERFPIWDDVRTFDGKPWRGHVDVVSGGFPCQDISVCGPGTGIDGERSGLWREMARIVGEVRPHYVFVENSPALTFRGLGRVLGDLAEMGFHSRYGVLGGSCVGNISEGERLWIVASQTYRPMLESVDLPAHIQPCEEGSCRRQFAGAVGAMLRQDDYTNLKRDAHAVAAGMDRLRCIGNGQMPDVAALAWQILRCEKRA
jgi:DNA (cytosine-5)-methyltransferase 1